MSTSTRLYELDEIAWLARQVELIRGERFEEIDYTNLKEFLESMANRDKRAVESRLERLIAHRLKWQFQSERRGPSWRYTIVEQQRALGRLFRSGSLRRHAEEQLEAVYQGGVSLARAEIGTRCFDPQCPWSLDDLLVFDPS